MLLQHKEISLWITQAFQRFSQAATAVNSLLTMGLLRSAISRALVNEIFQQSKLLSAKISPLVS
jgi:hypothetical protein